MQKLQAVVCGVLLCFILISCSAQAVSDPADKKGSKDHSLFARMPGYHIDRYETKKFDSYVFKEKRRTFAVEGRLSKISYCIKNGGPSQNEIQILRNYANAAVNIGGTVTASDDKDVFLKVLKDGMETWVHVHPWNQGDCYSLIIVERQASTTEAAADAAQMTLDMRATGKVTLYGIYFDSDKAIVKPESEPTLKEIAKFLRENPSIKIYVVGHTDATGDYYHNQKLSEARAQAVVMELVNKYRLSETRLKSFGVGPLSPVSANATSDGKAKNRRVELVEQ